MYLRKEGDMSALGWESQDWLLEDLEIISEFTIICLVKHN